MNLTGRTAELAVPNTRTAEGARQRFDVVVIGAGQAGLAIGYFLARAGRRFLIVDGADSIAATWRGRWDSLTLFTPRRYDSLPGLEFAGDPDGYPRRDEVIAYLEQLDRRHELSVSSINRYPDPPHPSKASSSAETSRAMQGFQIRGLPTPSGGIVCRKMPAWRGVCTLFPA